MRRKLVLPVTVIRCNGKEKLLAHTLDLTENSARLGGLPEKLEPGELIDIQRGPSRTKFQVVWMGAPGSAMEGQAGVRSMEPNRKAWGVGVPEDDSDATVNVGAIRDETAPTRSTHRPDEKRWHTRYECHGSASVRSAASGFPVHGEVKDIALGGVYIEISAALPVNTAVTVSLCIEDIKIEAEGIVRTSYQLLGMGVSFQNISPQVRERLAVILERVRRKGSRPAAVRTGEDASPASLPPELRLESYAASTVSLGFRTLAENFDQWKVEHSMEEVEELRQSVEQLQRKLRPSPNLDITDFVESAWSQGTA
jgi:hypothetical protein